MTDLCKCLGDNCELKNKCYRYTAPANPYWQSYLVKDTTEIISECNEFIPNPTRYR